MDKHVRKGRTVHPKVILIFTANPYDPAESLHAVQPAELRFFDVILRHTTWCHGDFTMGFHEFNWVQYGDSRAAVWNSEQNMWQTCGKLFKGFIWLYMAFYGFMMFKLRLVLSSN